MRNEGVISEKVPSVRNLQARPIKKQMTIRKRTAPESKGEYWDALPTKTKEKIAKKAVKKSRAASVQTQPCRDGRGGVGCGF
ncbi:MAG: hypothetical protein ACLURP_10080 [Ruminococcus sp.]